MKRFLAGLVRSAAMSFMLLCTVTVLMLLVLALILWWNGSLKKDRIEGAVNALRGVEPSAVEALPPSEKEAWRQMQEARRIEEKNLRQQREQLFLLRSLHETRMAQVDRAHKKLEEREKSLNRERSAFEKEREEWTKLRTDERFAGNLERYEAAPARTVAARFVSLTNSEIVRYLHAMRSDVVSSLLKAMEKMPEYADVPKDGGSKRLDEITRLMEKE